MRLSIKCWLSSCPLYVFLFYCKYKMLMMRKLDICMLPFVHLVSSSHEAVKLVLLSVLLQVASVWPFPVWDEHISLSGSVHCKQVWTALYLIRLWINTGRKWMWFYNDSPHTGSICFQRNPFKAALASYVYYFLLLRQISIFSFDYFLKPTLPCLIFAL